MPFHGLLGHLSEVARLGEEALTVEWRIRDVPELSQKGIDDFYESTTFEVGDGIWRLGLSPNRKRGDDPLSGWVRLDLERCDGRPPKTFHCTFGIKAEGGVEKEREVEAEFSGYDCCKWDDFCSLSDLLIHQKRWMPEDTLTIVCVLRRVVPGTSGYIDQLKKEVESCKKQIEILQKNHESESENYKRQIRALESEKSSIAEEFRSRSRLEEKLIERLEKDNEELTVKVESLEEQIEGYEKNIDGYCSEIRSYKSNITDLENQLSLNEERYRENSLSILTSCSELQNAKERLEMEVEFLSKQNKDLMEKCEMLSRNMSEASSALEKAASDDNAEGEKNENNNEDSLESNVKKNVKQPSLGKNTKKISLPTRHRDVIRSLKSILSGGRRADFTLKSGSRGWPIHKAILEGRSGYFETLLQGAQEDEVRLDDVAEIAMDVVLRFLYAGEVEDMSVENVSATYDAACKLDLGDLKSLSVDCMKEWMCPELVCGAMVITKTYREGELKKRALECFFREADRVFETKEWKQLKENHPDIIADLLVEMFKRKGESHGQ